MTLAMQQRVRGDLAPGHGSRLYGEPVDIQGVRLAPCGIRSGEKTAENFRRLNMQAERSRFFLQCAMADVAPIVYAVKLNLGHGLISAGQRLA
jgi:hypothetical protein